MSNDDLFIERDTDLTLEWLRPLNVIDTRTGAPFFDYTDARIPAGSLVFVDRATNRLRATKPNGDIIAWDGFTLIRISPGSSWDVTWRQPGMADAPSFGFVVEDGKLRISLEHMEGKEKLFEDFVGLMGSPQLCPPGHFRVPDGRYESNQLVDFMVTWGKYGAGVSLTPVQETIAVQPEVPNHFMISTNGMTVQCVRAKQTVHVGEGIYVGKVGTYHIHTGEVLNIKFGNQETRHVFSVSSKDLLHLVASGDAEIVKILQDRRPNY